jgi:hypothetical protein
VKVTINITPDTYHRMQMLLWMRVYNKGINYAAVIGGVIGGFTILISKYQTGSTTNGVLIAAYALAFYFMIAFATRAKAKKYMFSLGKAMYGNFTFETLDDGLHIFGEYFTKRFLYSAFTETLLVKDLLIIMTGDSSGFHLPITDANRAEIQAFNDDVRKRIGLIPKVSS